LEDALKFAIIENHQPLPVKLYGGIERISLFHFLAQCELKVHEPFLICLEGSTVSHPDGQVIQISKADMARLMGGDLPLDELVPDCDLVLTNTPERLAPLKISEKTKQVCVCHGDFREPTGSTHQIFLTRGTTRISQEKKTRFRADPQKYLCGAQRS
jgi:hypothetical protein